MKKNEMNNINILFEKSLKEIESKMKELFLNNIKIKENVKSIRQLENKNIYLDNAIKDKKTELNILKQLLLLKEKKKLNFDFIISKYLSDIILPKNIKKEEKKPSMINKKQVDSLLQEFNYEFNYYLNMSTKRSKKKLHRYNSDLFNKELLKKNHEDFMDKKEKENNHDIKNVIISNKNKVRDMSEKKNKNNYSPIKYEGNKNLKKSRENLEYYFLQNLKENKAKMDYISFIKLIFHKINDFKNYSNKDVFSKLLFMYKLNKIKYLLNFMQINKVIISRINEIMIKSSEIYNKNKNQEILEDDEFLKNINSNEYNEIEKKNKIQDYKKGLEKIKDINNEIYEIHLHINNFIDKFDQSGDG